MLVVSQHEEVVFIYGLSVVVRRWRERGVVVEINALDVLGSVGGLAS